MLFEPDFFINSNNMIKHCGLRRYRGNICRDVISLHNKEKYITSLRSPLLLFCLGTGE